MYRVHAAHRRLAASLVSLTDEQVRSPSLLPDWTVGHVIAHIALNAEAFTSVAADLRAGRVGVMYPRGSESRDADIEELAGAPAAGLIARVEATSAEFEAVWPTLTDDMLQGEFGRTAGHIAGIATDVPLRRLREIEVHHSDAGLPTFTWHDWSDGYVDLDLPVQLATVADRLGRAVSFADENGITYSCGDVAMDEEPIATSRRELLAWCFNRAQPAGLPPISGWQR